MANALIPARVSKSCPKDGAHIRNRGKAAAKPADQPVSPAQARSIALLRLTPAACRERMEQLEAWASVRARTCACACVCGGEREKERKSKREKEHKCELPVCVCVCTAL